MATPRIEIDSHKIAHNSKALIELYGSKGIEVFGVTKVVCGNPDIAEVLVKSGITILADSRLANIKRLRNAGTTAQLLLLRTPLLSQVEDVVRFTDISHNSEISIIEKLSNYAVKYNKIHKIILMVEMGDLREGIMPSELFDTIVQVIGMPGIKIAGLGTNLACFGGINPDDEKMETLSLIARDVEEKFGLKLEFVSGGNSANYNWFLSTKDVGRINNLRLGESIYLGCETLNRESIPGLFTDAFTLVTEVIEAKSKPSKPYGTVSQDAFGNVPKFKDNGQINRAILGVGLQDVPVSGLTARSDIEILGASSDHIIIDSKNIKLKVGKEVEFDMNYGALLAAMTSPYVIKNLV